MGRMPAIVLDVHRYTHLERTGALVSWLARCDNHAVGIISYVVGKSRHYAENYLIAYHDFFYVEPEWRSGLIPLSLYRVAEHGLRELGVSRIFQADHVRFISRGEAYQRLGYTVAEVIYEKILK